VELHVFVLVVLFVVVSTRATFAFIRRSPMTAREEAVTAAVYAFPSAAIFALFLRAAEGDIAARLWPKTLPSLVPPFLGVSGSAYVGALLGLILMRRLVGKRPVE
jgi:hypothetical protein